MYSRSLKLRIISFPGKTYQVLYPYNTVWSEEPVDFEEPVETILPDLFTSTAPFSKNMETVEELKQELMNIVPTRSVRKLNGAE